MVGRRGRESGVSGLEVLAAVALLMALFAVMLGVYGAQVRRFEEGVMTAQIRALRAQARIFRVIKGRWPAHTRELVESPLSLFPLGVQDMEEEPMSRLFKADAVMAVAVDGEGFPVDPRGNRYEYDSSTGEISTATEGHNDF